LPPATFQTLTARLPGVLNFDSRPS
jgi:hypothetical protein